jgi:thiamine kinase-like enzyme
MPSLVKVDFQIPGFNNEEFDISLLIHENHPQFQDYIDEFGKSLDDNFNKTKYS